MTRRTPVALVIGLTVVGIAASAQTRTEDTFRVAAVFDTAKGMVPGQQVKIAGAVVGKVEAVDLVPGPKARLTLSVSQRFHPFHADASCRLLPEGIISENFVDCDPGSPTRPPLSDSDGLPTVALARTSVPTSLQDVLNVFAAPTADRIRLLIGELGIAASGRGADLNALLRRANPALQQSTRLLKTINRQRDSLDRAVLQTDRVLATLAGRSGNLDRFVGRVADVTSTTASRSDALAESVRRLPALLDATRPALRSLDSAMADGTPLLRSLNEASPALETTTRKVPPFAAAASDALRRLSPVTDSGRRTVKAAKPLIRHLATAAGKAVPFAQDTDALLRDVRDRGGIEGMMRWLYGLANATAAYDSTSHFATGLLRVLPHCAADASTPGCPTQYNAPGQGTIPADDPSCGPQGGAPWDPPTQCRSKLPTKRRGKVKRGPKVSRPAIRRPGSAPADSSTRPAPALRPGVPRPDVKVPNIPGIDELGPLLDFLLGP